MATATRFPTGNATVTGTWTNGTTGLNADDGTNASFTTTTKNDSRNILVGTFGFHSVIPAGSVINSLSVEVQEQVTSGGTLRTVIERAGVAGANNDNTTDTALTVRTFSSLARPGGGSWTRDDLSDANLKVRVYGLQPNNTTSRTYLYDYVKVIVDYTAPVTAAGTNTLPALTQAAAAQHGTPVSASGANTLPALTQDASGERGANLGTAAQTLPALIQDATGERAPNLAQGASTLPALTSSATGEIPATEAVGASIFPALTQQATGDRAATTGQSSQTLPALTQSATGERGPTTATAITVLPALGQEASGERGANQAATVQTLPALTQTAEGERAATEAQAASTLPALTQQVTGTHGDVISGAISSTFPALQQAATGDVEEPEIPQGEVTSVLPALSGSVVARAVVSGGAASILPALVTAVTQAELGVPVEGPTTVAVSASANTLDFGGMTSVSMDGSQSGYTGDGSENSVDVEP